MILKNNRYFLIPYLIFLIIGAIILILYPKASLHLFINKYHNSFSDTFFKYATYVSEGLIVSMIILALAYYKIRNGLLLFSSFLFSALLAQFLKRVVFNEYPRPKAYFEGIANLRYVDDVVVHTSFSFPSGHATAAFTLFFALSVLARKNWQKTSYFFAALMVAWSRVHLSQHFLVDIYFGSLLGVSCTIAVFLFFNGRFPEGLLIDRPLKELIGKKNHKQVN